MWNLVSCEFWIDLIVSFRIKRNLHLTLLWMPKVFHSKISIITRSSSSRASNVNSVTEKNLIAAIIWKQTLVWKRQIDAKQHIYYSCSWAYVLSIRASACWQNRTQWNFNTIRRVFCIRLTKRLLHPVNLLYFYVCIIIHSR